MKINLIYALITSGAPILSSSLVTAQEKTESLTAKLITMTVSAGYDKDNKDLQDIMFFNSTPQLKLSYLVEEKNIIQIVENSLVVKNSTPSKNWKSGFFANISKSSNAALFTIEHTDNLVGKDKNVTLNGSIQIQTGTKLIKKDLELKKINTPVKIEDYTFTLNKDKLKVQGKHSFIQNITVTLNGKEMKTNGSSWSGTSKTYNYQGIDEGAKVSFSYWAGAKTKKVTFSY